MFQKMFNFFKKKEGKKEFAAIHGEVIKEGRECERLANGKNNEVGRIFD